MYLVELRPGKEELYRTGDELAAAIRSGDVDMHSRIYHRATSKWISVTLHPQYKAIVAERPAPPPLPALERSTWTFFNDSADSLEGANAPDEPSPGAKRPDEGDSEHAWRRPLALSVAGGLLLLGLQLAASGPRPPWAAREAQVSPETAARPAAMPVTRVASPTVSLVDSRASWAATEAGYVTTSGASGPRPPAAPALRDSTRPVLPAAPRVRSKALLKDALSGPAEAPETDASSVGGMLQRWTAAHDSALVRLESGMRVARLNQLFAAGRLSPTGGVTETRMSLAGVANFVRVYRQQQAEIEREYQDSFSTVSKEQRWSPAAIREWYSKASPAESPALAALTSSLIGGLDSLLGVLDAQAGAYAVNESGVRFEDAGAARSYSALRQRITATVDSAKAAGGAGAPGPMRYLLQAIGTTRLPRAS
ncbi:MAG TPA: hypothetical protein VFG66_00365 [Gemmatimonadales bacterium]|nr:hypothetical protein [Gemmatimonadales bacterium]